MPAKKRLHLIMKFNPKISSVQEAREKLDNAKIFLGEGTPEFDLAIRTLRNQSTGEAKAFLLERFADYHSTKKTKTKRTEKIFDRPPWKDFEVLGKHYERNGNNQRAISHYESAAKAAYDAGNREKHEELREKAERLREPKRSRTRKELYGVLKDFVSQKNPKQKLELGFQLLDLIQEAALKGHTEAQKNFHEFMKNKIFPLCKNIKQKMAYYQRFGEFFEAFDEFNKAAYNYAVAAGYAEKIKQKEIAQMLRERIEFLKKN